MAISVNIPPIETISTTDAIWSLIVNQKKSVQKVLASRLAALYKTEAQQAYVSKTLTHAINEAREAHMNGTPLPDARHLFDDKGEINNVSDQYIKSLIDECTN